MLSMDIKELEKRLRAAEKAIQKTLALIAQQAPDPSVQRVQVGTCRTCGKALYNSDRITRTDMHLSCYNTIYSDLVRSGKKTIEQLEADGTIGPGGKSGRPKKSASKAAIATAEAQAREVLKKRTGKRKG